MRHSDKQARCKEAYSAIISTTFTEPFNHSLLDHIKRKMDGVVQLKRRKDPTVKVFYPSSLVFPILKGKAPEKLTMHNSWCATTGKFTETLVVHWSVTDPNDDVISKLFGDSFGDRMYPDSEGVINFKMMRGGRMRCVVSNKTPISIVFDTYLQELELSFHFVIEKAICHGGDVTFTVIC